MKQLLIVVLLLMIKMVCYSQFNDDEVIMKELGFSVGVMNCNTDIEGQIADAKNFRPAFGLFASALYRQKIGVRLEGTVGTVTASDSRAMKYSLKARNLDFTSIIKEVSLLAELHPFNFSTTNDLQPAISPYVLLGIGYFGFDPKTSLNGQWIYLQPLHTEGEGFPGTGRPNYKLSAINIPVGGGLFYRISDRVSLRGEAIYRFLTTDYLDDVSTTYIDPSLFDEYLSADNAILAKQLADRSYEIPNAGKNVPGSQRGSPKKDAYYSINIKLGIRLAKGDNDGKPIVKRKHSCYTL